jgi:hypothetical protein
MLKGGEYLYGAWTLRDPHPGSGVDHLFWPHGHWSFGGSFGGRSSPLLYIIVYDCHAEEYLKPSPTFLTQLGIFESDNDLTAMERLLVGITIP